MPPGIHTRHRRCLVFRGDAGTTRFQALECVQDLPRESILWVSESAEDGAVHVRPGKLAERLGRSFDVVVLDLHDDLNPDTVGQAHGFVWGGGALILRLPPAGDMPERVRERLTVFPHGPEEVGGRFLQRFDRLLDANTGNLSGPLPPAHHAVEGSAEQRALITDLVGWLNSGAPSLTVILADRGRGKSAAIGRAVRELHDSSRRIAITAGSPDATLEVLRFAELPADAFVPTQELLHGEGEWDLIVVDEAAQLPVPVLQRMVERHPNAHFAFATTTHGYEGTGRGFVLRFLEWLETRARPVTIRTLAEPIRWGASDPLEALIFDLLLLHAEPPEIPGDLDDDAIVHQTLDRDALIRNEALLKSFFGLLVHAHYRTTPSDLHRILDAPNVRLHALTQGDHALAATMVALEGGLEEKTCDDLYWGRCRVRGHALPETLASHSGQRDAGMLSIVRSVRIAVHPALRRRGLATRLIGHVHESYQPDLFGTLFGLSPGLLQFRRSVGYELVRVGASRGTRTGEPAVVMMRPVSERATSLFESLRMKLARQLNAQLALMQAGRELLLADALIGDLNAGLPAANPLSKDERMEAVTLFANGPRTHEAACIALGEFVADHADALTHLEPGERALIQARILEGMGWEDAASAANLPSVPAAMRALRRAVRALVEHVAIPQEP